MLIGWNDEYVIETEPRPSDWLKEAPHYNTKESCVKTMIVWLIKCNVL